MKSMNEIEEKLQELDKIASASYREGDWKEGNHYSVQVSILKWVLEDSEKKTTIEMKSIPTL